jgi:hypothetical protein
MLLFCVCSVLTLSVSGVKGEGETHAPFLDNYIVGTQAIGGPYQFSSDSYLVEVAEEIHAMGSNLIKFALSPKKYAKRPYKLDKIEGVESMRDLLVKHPEFQKVMSMDFRYYHIWANPYCTTRWHDGVNEKEEDALYREFYELVEYLLTEYAGTGKAFFLGHWEGDWLLSGAMNAKVDPTPERIAGFAQYLNIRQRAVNDAKATLEAKDVWVYHYTEVNLVVKGLDGSRPTLTNSVLPLVDVDFVSYSSYDSIQVPNMQQLLHQALDHIESNMKPRPNFPGKRVFVGEYGIKGAIVDYDPIEHERRNREITKAIVEWGCPFALYWQFYCNEPRGDGYEGFWLVDDQNQQLPLYNTFKGYYSAVRTYIEESFKTSGKDPSPSEIRAFAVNYLREKPND